MQRISEAAVSSLPNYLRLFRRLRGNRRAGDGREVRGNWIRSFRCHFVFLPQSGTLKEKVVSGGGWSHVGI